MHKSAIRISLGVSVILLASCASSIRFPTVNLFEPYDNPKMVWGNLRLPEGEGPFAAIVLLHTCGGLMPHVNQDWPNYLTGLGYAVLVVDSLGSRGVSKCEQIKYRRIRIQAEDAYGALDYLATLQSIDADRVGVMGFSTGAVAINSIIANYRRNEIDEIDFKAAVSLYGVCRSIYGYDSDSVPLMAIVGEKDVRLAPDCIAAGKQIPGLEVHVFPGAYHAFDSRRASGKINSGGDKMRYSKSATNMARQLTKGFFAKHLGK